jgi:hypothetical protein
MAVVGPAAGGPIQTIHHREGHPARERHRGGGLGRRLVGEQPALAGSAVQPVAFVVRYKVTRQQGAVSGTASGASSMGRRRLARRPSKRGEGSGTHGGTQCTKGAEAAHPPEPSHPWGGGVQSGVLRHGPGHSGRTAVTRCPVGRQQESERVRKKGGRGRAHMPSCSSAAFGF